MKGNILWCKYCDRVSIHSKTFKLFVCDDCYAKGLGGDKDVVD